MDIDTVSIILSKLDLQSYINATKVCKLFYKASKNVLPIYTDNFRGIPNERFYSCICVKVNYIDKIYPNMHIFNYVNNTNLIALRNCTRLTIRVKGNITLPYFNKLEYINLYCHKNTQFNSITLSNIKEVEIEYIQVNLSWFVNVEKLSISNAEVNGNISILKKIKEISFVACEVSEHIPKINIDKLLIYHSTYTGDLSEVKELEVLGNVCHIESYNNKKVILEDSTIFDVTGLRSVKDISIGLFSELSDVSALKDAHRLSLTNCNSLSNVSMLGNIYYLNLSSCINVSDVSSLGNVTYLNISNTNVKDVSMLHDVYSLNLSGCYITRFNTNHRNYYLDISNCDIYNMQKFRNVKNINIKCNRVVKSIKCLENAESVIIGNNECLVEYCSDHILRR